jgi:hypothetical protein
MVCYQLILSATVWEVFENFEMPPCCPSILFVVFPPNTWSVSRDKRIESLSRLFLDHRLYWYQAHTYSAVRHVDPDSNKSHVLEL